MAEDIKNERQQASSEETTKTVIGDHENDDNKDLIEKILQMDKPPLPTPKPTSKCPLFCCFYAEFDIKVGPKIFFQSPRDFMDQEINISTTKIQDILETTFQSLNVDNQDNNKGDVVDRDVEDNGDESKHPAEAGNHGNGAESATEISNEDVNDATDGNNNNNYDTVTTGTSKTTSVASSDDGDNNNGDSGNSQHQESVAVSTITATETASSKLSSDGDTNNKKDEDYYEPSPSTNSQDLAPAGTELSIFDSTSEYIITGNELTGKIVTLSTHNMHIMTRPTLISDERYERNSLLFAIGIVLRRAADPRPFRPLISKLAVTLRSMEIESQFLSNPTLRNRHLQPLLERVLVSLNSSQWECNLLVSPSNALNLKLFHPPKPDASNVYNHQVPILLRRDLQLQMYDWDLSINWVILHIDGATNARQISIKAEVDLEMVRACLRVLKHHGVIDLVDMFLYTNRYEFTEKATSMLAGKEGRTLQDAVDFVMKRQHGGTGSNFVHSSSPTFGTGVGGVGERQTSHGGDSSDRSQDRSQYYNYNHNSTSPIHHTSPSSSYPPNRALTVNSAGGGGAGGSSHKSSTLNKFASMMAAHSYERESTMGTSMTRGGGIGGGRQSEDQRTARTALAELYCACNRSVNFGDLWISLSSEVPTSLSIPAGATSTTTTTPTKGSTFGRKNSNDSDNVEQQQHYHQYGRNRSDSLAMSPLETFHFERLRDRSTAQTIDWNDFFSRFDHRRFCSFGQVYGLLRRVHDYPFFPGAFPDLATSLQQNQSTMSLNSNSKQTSSSFREEEKLYTLAKNVAAKMDGTICDDELVCLYEKPYNQLVGLVERFGKKKILSIYATTASSV